MQRQIFAARVFGLDLKWRGVLQSGFQCRGRIRNIMAGILTGIAWYRRQEWPLLRSLAEDAETLAVTYDEWLLVAEQTYARMQAEGYMVEKVDVPLQDLVQWCAAHGRPLDEAARSSYVAHKLRDRDAMSSASQK